MTSNPPTRHQPARWRAKAAVLTTAAIAALGGAAIPLTASAAPAAAVTATGPTVHEQQALNQNIPIATGAGHTTTAISSPVLAARNYLVNLAIGVNNITPGSVVLCGLTTSTSTDVVTGNYGQIENEGSTASSGNCAVTSTVTLNNPNDHIIAWASVYSGPSGATIGDTSMNELPVGTVDITH